MKISITEEMKTRQKIVEYAIKHDNNAKAARKYETRKEDLEVKRRCAKHLKGIVPEQ